MITFEQFYRDNFKETRRKIYWKTGSIDMDKANDLTQDVFVKANRYFEDGSYDGLKQQSWLGFIIQSVVVDWWRAEKRRNACSYNVDEDDRATALDVIPCDNVDVDVAMEKLDSKETLAIMLTRIPKQQAEVLKRFYNGESMKDMAESYGLSINTILGIKRYGIINLKKLVVAEGIEVTI